MDLRSVSLFPRNNELILYEKLIFWNNSGLVLEIRTRRSDLPWVLKWKFPGVYKNCEIELEMIFKFYLIYLYSSFNHASFIILNALIKIIYFLLFTFKIMLIFHYITTLLINIIITHIWINLHTYFVNLNLVTFDVISRS